MMTQIRITKNQIVRKMYEDTWITLDQLTEGEISIELILMYQHNVIPIQQEGVDFDQDKCFNATISGQLRAREEALAKTRTIFGTFVDEFSEGLAMIHQTQINKLRNLKNLMITQFN
jgi:hypothetical protein